MHFTRVSTVALFVMASACSSSSTKSGPVVNSFDAPDSVATSTVNGQLAYAITGTLAFSDSAEDVVSFTAHLNPLPNSSVTIEDSTVRFPTPTETGSQGISLAIPADPAGKTGVPPGNATYTISVTSASGIISQPLTKTITLQ